MYLIFSCDIYYREKQLNLKGQQVEQNANNNANKRFATLFQSYTPLLRIVFKS
jgi:hypothetical protein